MNETKSDVEILWELVDRYNGSGATVIQFPWEVLWRVLDRLDRAEQSFVGEAQSKRGLSDEQMAELMERQSRQPIVMVPPDPSVLVAMIEAAVNLLKTLPSLDPLRGAIVRFLSEQFRGTREGDGTTEGSDRPEVL